MHPAPIEPPRLPLVRHHRQLPFHCSTSIKVDKRRDKPKTASVASEAAATGTSSATSKTSNSTSCATGTCTAPPGLRNSMFVRQRVRRQLRPGEPQLPRRAALSGQRHLRGGRLRAVALPPGP
ncbi:hypothetical protein ZWY2020_036698 [Hordeum vulgare]|nr:hypothetical protein ZWY2020_036698 [Hordeum vulgare]